MRKIMLAVAMAAAALSLGGCAGLAALASLPSSPAAVADKTVLDEKAALSTELAYNGFLIAAELAVDAGLLKGSSAARVQEIDKQAYAALAVMRAAYEAGNADSYGTAIVRAHKLIFEGIALTRGDQS